MSTLFVNRLTNLDFSYLDPHAGIVGESWLLDIQLAGNLNEQGMILDFGLVKKQVRNYVDQFIDHCLLVPTQYEGCTVNNEADHLVIDFELEAGGRIHHASVSSAVALIDARIIDVNSVRETILGQLRSTLPDNVHHLDIQLYPQPDLENSYCYSHGLQKHEGNCQRIAHGHRSDLKIYLDEQESVEWKRYWMERWQDIYIASRNHLKAETETTYEMEYQAEQGKFELNLPKSRVYFIETESTVENIAQHLADETASRCPGKSIRVIAFEGIGKGAIAEAKQP